MAIFLFILEKLFALLMPELIVWIEVVGAVSFRSEYKFVQNSLSINCKFVILMIAPLLANPPSKKGLVLLITLWHHTMALLLFKLDKLFIFHIPLPIPFRHGSQKALLEAK
jgi:hypothetical protein